MLDLFDWKTGVAIFGALGGFALRFPATFKANFGKLLIVYFFLSALLLGWLLGNLSMHTSLQSLLPPGTTNQYKTMRENFDQLQIALMAFGAWAFFLDWISGQIIQHEKKSKSS